ncbi:hypothetical protein FTUN_0612 [Frigoriglobus tundricola]|uniref:Uncharacterized protein n=2 Tax=Frigoriglobus tundricola TaxID=2774151 RepID=A0A6M5YGD5_9BACT|nr:hypothetical protein FTUN_0612 [Frigoriglobus tundricola]
MCPRTPAGPNTPPFDPNTLPPKLRAVYDSARRLAQIRAERVLLANTIKALERTSGKKPATAEQPAPVEGANRDDCDAEGTPPV